MVQSQVWNPEPQESSLGSGYTHSPWNQSDNKVSLDVNQVFKAVSQAIFSGRRICRYENRFTLPNNKIKFKWRSITSMAESMVLHGLTKHQQSQLGPKFAVQ